MSLPLQIFYPNGGTQAVQMYVWDSLASEPILWDGEVTFSGSITIGTVSGDKSNNATAPTNDNLGVLPAVANAAAPSYTEGRQVLLSTNLAGALRVAATIDTTGLATSAKQDTGNASLASIDTKLTSPITVTGPLTDTQLRATAVSVSAASLPLPTGAATLAEQQTQTASLSVIDDWDESDRAKVNLIVGQAGVAAGAGNAGATVVRVVIATDQSTLPVAIINGKTIKSLSGSFTADTDIIAAVTSKRIKVIGYAFFTFGTSATTILLKSNGTGGTLLWTVALQAITGTAFGANMTIASPSFIFATAAGEKLTADTNTGDTVYWSISYFDDDAA